MINKAATTLAATLILSGVASAETGTLRVTKSAALNASPADVWAVMGKFDDMSWHPAVKTTKMAKDAPAEAPVRILHLKSDAGDPTITETLTKVDDAGRCYSYVITKVDHKVVPVNNYASTLCVKNDGDKAIVEWSGTFDAVKADAADEKAATDAISGIYDGGLAALAEKFGARK